MVNRTNDIYRWMEPGKNAQLFTSHFVEKVNTCTKCGIASVTKRLRIKASGLAGNMMNG